MNSIFRYICMSFAGLLAGLIAHDATAQIVSPAPGVPVPQSYYDTVSRTPGAYRFQKAWIQKTRRAKQAREAYLSAAGEPERLTFESLPEATRQQMLVGGSFEVPVIMVDYANRAAEASFHTNALRFSARPLGTIGVCGAKSDAGAFSYWNTSCNWTASSVFSSRNCWYPTRRLAPA